VELGRAGSGAVLARPLSARRSLAENDLGIEVVETTLATAGRGGRYEREHGREREHEKGIGRDPLQAGGRSDPRGAELLANGATPHASVVGQTATRPGQRASRLPVEYPRAIDTHALGIGGARDTASAQLAALGPTLCQHDVLQPVRHQRIERNRRAPRRLVPAVDGAATLLVESRATAEAGILEAQGRQQQVVPRRCPARHGVQALGRDALTRRLVLLAGPVAGAQYFAGADSPDPSQTEGADEERLVAEQLG
jgi:hypothetical protein